MVAVGEIFLGAFLQLLFQKLMSEELLKFARREGVHKKLKKWSTTLQMIQAVLFDAEEKHLTSEAVKLWLDDLRDLAYDVEDILDKFSTQLVRRKIQTLRQASSSKLWRFIPTPTRFKFNIDLEINKVTRRLQDISRRKSELGLNEIARSVMEWKRPPSSSLPDGPVVGRDEDKKKIVELLLRDDQRIVNFDVVGIVGMAGVGKTTLAGLLFNDDAMKHFDIKVWVCVSDDFDYVRLTKAILKSMKTESEINDEFSQLQVHLSKVLAGKKFFIVLDDVWNTKDDLHDLWVTFRSPFRSGAPGSKIIVTTREVHVPKVMGAVQYYNLECVSDDDCWKVFVQHAFLKTNTSELPNLGTLREKIIAKCNGLPLAARTLGGLLHCKEINEWEDILNNKLWTLSAKGNILPLLRLSYHYLPSHLKRCFGYCAILPEDYEFEEKQLILLWMAEGLIQQPEGSRQVEDLGREYFHELLSRSFFQKSRKDESKYVMHDLMNELAQWVAGEICFRLEDKLDGDKQCRIFEKARHSSYISAKFDGIQRLGVFSKVKHLRTFLPLAESYSSYDSRYLSDNFTLHILPKLKCLRVLSLKGYCIGKLPDSIGELKPLRYLDLSYTDIVSLPESTSSLYNLQTLLLEGCDNLNALPTGMSNLTQLRHLINSNQGSLEGMPSDIGKSTNLQTLSYFVVGKQSGSPGVGELGHLLHLSGTLHISRLENVNSAKDAAMANLAGKNGIDILLLEWNGGEIADPNIFEMLQPPRLLKELNIKSYSGVEFPTWMGSPSFSNMVLMRLEDCNGCRILPPLGQLVSLKELIIISMYGVESIGSEFYGEGCLKPFPLLEKLCFENMENWKDWFPVETNDGIDGFPQLKELFLIGCPKLKGTLPETLPSLTKLVVDSCEQLVVSIPSNQMLCELDITNCKEVIRKNDVDFKSLRSINVSDVSKFRYLTEGFMQGLTGVEDLKVSCCKKISSLLGDELQQLTSLCHLEIEESSMQYLTLVGEETGQVELQLPSKLETLELRNCDNLVKVVHLTLLQELHIYGCQTLTSFPDSSLLHSLKVLHIEKCDKLKSLVQEEYNSSSSSNCTPNCLESLVIRECPSLKSISSANGSLPARFTHLDISYCGVLQCLSWGKLPDNLRKLEIHCCGSLICLSSEGELPEATEHLQITSCNRLTSLSTEAKLPKALKHLEIGVCGELKWITDKFYSNTCLEYIYIVYCKKFRSLPEGLHQLINLRELNVIGCEKLVSLPEGGLPTSNLRDFTITCKNLVAIPKGIHNLSCLQKLEICHSEGLMRVLEQQGFPQNLISLTICMVKVSKPLLRWGLHRLKSLRELDLSGEAADIVCFPPEGEEEEEHEVLPNSLISLRIKGFQNLEKLSTGNQCLTSLQYLSICTCQKLKTGSSSFTFEASNIWLPSARKTRPVFCISICESVNKLFDINLFHRFISMQQRPVFL